MKKFKENLSGHVFFVLALSSVAALLIITVFIVLQGAPALPHIFGMEWAPTSDYETGQFGIIPMILGSLAVTAGAALIGVPFGICCAIFMAELAPARMQKIFRPTIQLLAGIPSVVYGFWGMIVIVPFIRDYIGGPGLSILAGSIVLSIMTLPTIISISEVSIVALPRTYKEGALALGMTHWQTIRSVQLPAAKSGIVASVILGLGRAVGETMAVIMVMGNAPAVPNSIFEAARSLTAHIGIEMGYAGEGPHRESLFATGIVLFVIIMGLNVTAQYLTRKKSK
jgi:phosphate transport system permease protein